MRLSGVSGMLAFPTSLNKGAQEEPIRKFTAKPQLTPHFPRALWRKRKPEALSLQDVSRLRRALLATTLPSEPDWNRAILGDAAVAVGIAVRQLKLHKITDLEVDLALSAVLACAIEGEPTAPIVISSALRRRSKKFHRCLRLSLLWGEAKF
jgi:hypothetical protein